MQLLQNGKQQWIDQNGLPLANGSVGFYAPGTLNPQATYQDQAGTIQNTNPITLDSRGQAIVWGTGTYRQIVKDSLGVTIWDQVVTSSATTSDLAALAGTTGAGGAASIGFDGGTVAAFFKSKNNRVVDSIVGLRALDKTLYTRAFVTGYYSAGDGGGGSYWYDSSDTTSTDNGGTIIVATDGGRWKLEDATPSALQFGLKGDGTTDESTLAQTYIDTMKGKTVRFPAGRQYVMAGVTLSGSTYNRTRVIFEGEMLVKAMPLQSSTTFGGAWVGLLFKDVDGCELVMRGHGNRANQPQSEFCYVVGLAAATNMKIPYFAVRELRGDGLYVDMSIWTANSANSSGLTIGVLEGTNSVTDGRNLLSIVSCDNVTIDTVRSYNIGGTVNSVIEPGGVDIEPNRSDQSCKNITIANVNVVTAGTNGLAVLGIAGAQVTQNVVIGVANVTNIAAATQADANAAVTQTPNHCLVVSNAQDVTVETFQGSYINAYGDCIVLSNSSDVKIRGAVRHVREGIRAGNDTSDSSGSGLINCDVDLKVSDVSRYGFRVGKVAGCKIRGNSYLPSQSYYPGGVFSVYTLSYAQSNTEYSVDCRYDANWTRSYRNDNGTPATYTNVAIRDCDCSGAWTDYTAHVGDMQVPRFNVRSVTDQGTTPTVGTNLWVAGQYVKNNAAVVGAPKGWYFAGGAWVSEGNL